MGATWGQVLRCAQDDSWEGKGCLYRFVIQAFGHSSLIRHSSFEFRHLSVGGCDPTLRGISGGG
jgi:hypothetical protein